MKKHCDIEECNGINSGIDPCIQQIVKALNDGGIETVASCCGHGNTIGSIILKDGREFIIAPDYETARKVEQYWPDIHGKWRPQHAQKRALRDAQVRIAGLESEVDRLSGELKVREAHTTDLLELLGLVEQRKDDLAGATESAMKLVMKFAREVIVQED